MFRSMRRIVLIGLLASGVVVVTGCGKKGSRPPIDQATIVGSWIEVVAQGRSNPRIKLAEATELRQITIKADNSFEFVLLSKSGEPLKKNEKAEGTWKIDPVENALVFEVTNNTFPADDERRDWAPASSLGLSMREIGGQGQVEILEIIDLQDAPTAFKRQ